MDKMRERIQLRYQPAPRLADSDSTVAANNPRFKKNAEASLPCTRLPGPAELAVVPCSPCAVCGSQQHPGNGRRSQHSNSARFAVRSPCARFPHSFGPVMPSSNPTRLVRPMQSSRRSKSDSKPAVPTLRLVLCFARRRCLTLTSPGPRQGAGPAGPEKVYRTLICIITMIRGQATFANLFCLISR